MSIFITDKGRRRRFDFQLIIVIFDFVSALLLIALSRGFFNFKRIELVCRVIKVNFRFNGFVFEFLSFLLMAKSNRRRRDRTI